jgi:hypothetical protein
VRREEEREDGPWRPIVMKRAFAVLLAAVFAVVPAPPADASCAESDGVPRPADYAQVFAGVVERTTNGGGAAEVRVLDVWHGPALPPRVVVVGGQLVGGAQSSVDRSYTTGQSYGFFLYRGDDYVLRDNACTPTAPLTSLGEVDPPGIRLPDPRAAAPTDPRACSAVRTPWYCGCLRRDSRGAAAHGGRRPASSSAQALRLNSKPVHLRMLSTERAFGTDQPTSRRGGRLWPL